jgi:hypothetical protein
LPPIVAVPDDGVRQRTQHACELTTQVTSSARSPELFAYNAALILLDARVLFSQLRVSDLLNPAIRANRSSLERHHLFPKAHLSRLGHKERRTVNQIANYALVEWPDNAAILDRAPAEYFPPLMERLGPAEAQDARFWHALPAGWEQMEYEEFLEARRPLMADVIRTGFEYLRGQAATPSNATHDQREPAGLATT